MENYFKLIEQWGKEKGILDKATPHTQFTKLLEEVGELHQGITKYDHKEIKDAIGDCVVVLTLLAKLTNTNIEDCIKIAYNEIKDRKGQMVNGTFVKEVK